MAHQDTAFKLEFTPKTQQECRVTTFSYEYKSWYRYLNPVSNPARKVNQIIHYKILKFPTVLLL